MMNLISKLFLMFWMFVSSGDMTPEYYFSSWKASNVPGMFFPIDDYYLIFAKGEGAALHEVGHIRNIEEGYTSETPEFEAAVILYLDTADITDGLGWQINNYYRQGRLDDVYAELYMWDILYSIPHEFEEFYAR